jgi:2-polyprenyl-3-methyl-5-hydroxy-6-metoxy-1,4-benzoquinol methylase
MKNITKPVSSQELVDFLKRQHVNAAWLDQLKIAYRPLICPFDELLALVTEGSHVFDVGCGSGQFALLLAEFTPVAAISGVEISQHLVDNAHQLLAPYQNRMQLEFARYDGQHFPASLGQADWVFIIDVLHHVPKAAQSTFLQAIYTGMKPGARLVLKDINGGSPWVVANKLHDLVFAREIGNELGFAKARQQLDQLGFAIERASTKQMYVYPHYTLVARKPD